VVRGILAAKKKGAKTVALTGKGGGRLAKMADMSVVVPSTSTPRIQEAHITIGHILCELIEKKIFDKLSALKQRHHCRRKPILGSKLRVVY